MPLKVKKIGNKFRLTEPSGSIAKNKKGTPIDGGGHKTKEKAKNQILAIEVSQMGGKIE